MPKYYSNDALASTRNHRFWARFVTNDHRWRSNMKLALVSVLAAVFGACSQPAIAAPFICKTIKADGSGTGFATATARITDAGVRAGFRLTGGGCLSSEHGYMEKSVPDTTTYSYTCSLSGVTDNVSIKISAYAVACRSN
jgi:hypothetical protein